MSKPEHVVELLLDGIYETLTGQYMTESRAQYVIDEIEHVLAQAVHDAFRREDDSEVEE